MQETQQQADEPRSAALAPDDEVMTVDQVASMIKQTPAWVRAHASKKRRPYLPGMKMGKYRRVRRSSVVAWMSQLEREAQS